MTDVNNPARRGLIRLWILGSAVWAAAALIYGYVHCSFDTFPGTSAYCLDELYWKHWWEIFIPWPELIGWIIAISLLALAMGFAVAWVVAGFRR